MQILLRKSKLKDRLGITGLPAGATVHLDARVGILKAGDIPATDGAAVTAIQDQSGSGNSPDVINGVTYRTGPARLEVVGHATAINWSTSPPQHQTEGTMLIVTDSADISFVAAGGETSASFVGAAVSGSASTSCAGNIASSPLPTYRGNGVALTANRGALYTGWTGKKVLALRDLDLSAWGTTHRLLQYNHATAFLFDGDIYEYAYYPSELDDETLAEAEAWLMAKHGIS